MAIRPWLLPLIPLTLPVLGTSCKRSSSLRLPLSSPQLQFQFQSQSQFQRHSSPLYIYNGSRARARARHRQYSSTNGPQSQSQSQSQTATSSAAAAAAGGRRRFIVPIFGLLLFTVGVYELGHWRGGSGAGQGVFGDGAGSLLRREGMIFMAPRRSSKLLNMPDEAPQYASLREMMKAVHDIQQKLGEDSISTDDEDLLFHGYSSVSTVNSDRLPVAVAYPKSTSETAEIARICHKYRVPIIPFSGGSSLEGHFSAPFGGISVDFAHMDQILDLHEDEYAYTLSVRPAGSGLICKGVDSMDVVVQPSVSWVDLNEKVKHTGLFFPIDPGPSAKIGGMVGTNCSGTNAVRYGTMKDWVINLTVVLADGSIIKTKRRPRKSSAGYNLNQLFVGSEGTLGLVTEVTLKLAVIPEETSVAVVSFPTIRDAAAVASKVMRAGIPIAAMEIMDDVQMRMVNQDGRTGRLWKEAPTLFFKFSGTKVAVKDNIEGVQKIAKLHTASKFEFAKNEKEKEQLWSARKESLWCMVALRREGQEVWSTDVAVPLSRLADLIEVSKKELDELGILASILGHIGDGNFHEGIMYDRTDPEEVKRVEMVVNTMIDRALAMEGTCTGEHGVGMGKKEYLVKELGLDTLGVMKKIKYVLDPCWIMNPGKIIDYK